MDDARRAELKAFLRRMRGRLAPEAAGLPAAGRRRRAPGLRIEEAAALAGVSLTWYSALESGKGARVSANMLDRIAQALRLDAAEREMLVRLTIPPREVDPPAADDALLRKIVDGFTAGPAAVADQFWNVRAYNALADAVYGWTGSSERNILVRMLADDGFRGLHTEWETIARQMVAVLHLSFGRSSTNARAGALVARLRRISPQFSDWWDDYRVSRFVPKTAELRHPTLGSLRIVFSSFVESAVRDADEPLIILLQPAADDATQQRFRAYGQSIAP